MSKKHIFKEKVLKISKIYASIMLVIQFASVLLFCDGVVLFYGREITISSSVNIIKDFPRMLQSFSYYRGWFGMLLGFLYIATLIYIIVNSVRSFLIFNKIRYSKKYYQEEPIEDLIFSIGYIVGNTFFALIAFMVIYCAVKNFLLPTNAYIAIALGVIVFIMTRIIYTYVDSRNLSIVGVKGLFLLLFISSVFMVFCHSLKESVIENFFVWIRIPFSLESTEATIEMLLIILHSIIQICVITSTLIILATANRYINLKNYEMQKISYGLIIIVGIILVVKMTICMSDGVSSASIVKTLTEWKEYIPLICAVIALHLSTRLDVTIMKNEDEKVQINEISKDGVLKIKSEVTEIKSCTYEDCSNITQIIIPKDVLVIEKDAFYGCGGVTGIYCEAESKPNGWDPEWNNGCYATVHWNCDLSKLISDDNI